MTREISIEESYDWLRSTLEGLASIPQLNDDDFAYVAYEVLDADVCSALSEVALDRLVAPALVSDPARIEILALRSTFMALLESAYAARSSPVALIRSEHGWLEVSQSAERILAQHIPALPDQSKSQGEKGK